MIDFNRRLLFHLLVKEGLEYVRGWRAWLTFLLLPLIVFPVALVLPAALQRPSLPTSFDLAVQSESEDSPFVQALVAAGPFTIVDVPQQPILTVEVIRGHQVDKFDRPDLRVTYRGDKREARAALAAFKAFVDAYSISVTRASLAQLGIDPAIGSPLSLEIIDTSTPGQRGGEIVSLLVPLLLAVSLVMGGLIQGSDAIAGEKERGTIETLLLIPVPPNVVLTAKYSVILVSNLANAVAGLVGLLLALKWSSGSYPMRRWGSAQHRSSTCSLRRSSHRRCSLRYI